MNILIAEDDFTSRMLLQEILKGYGSVCTVINGQEAVEAVKIGFERDEPFDLICLDIMMPETDGHQALKEIRKIEQKRGVYSSDGVKIIMATALGDMRNISEAYSELCDGYLVKPIDKKSVLKTVDELFNL